jgi:transposase
MEYYVGLDVSLKQTSICVVDKSGSVVREGVVDSDPEAISVYVRSKAPGRGTHRPRDRTDVYLVMD